jgi:hypothetical protein
MIFRTGKGRASSNSSRLCGLAWFIETMTVTTMYRLPYYFFKPFREHFVVLDIGILGREMEAERDSAHLPQPFRVARPLSMMLHCMA